jgi:hypothetical protein
MATATTAPTIRSIAITTRIDIGAGNAPGDPQASKRRSGPARKILPALVSGLLGVIVVSLALPRTLAAWNALEAQSAIEKLQTGKPPSDEELAVGVRGLKRALEWTPSARRATDLALLRLEQASRLSKEDSARLPLLNEAERYLVEGLLASPANGFAWLRLAIVRELREAPPRDIAAALAQSVDMAPSMRKLWLPRAMMLLAYWRDLTFEELLALRAHLRTVWESDSVTRAALLQAAVRSGELPMLAWAVGEKPPTRADVDALKTAPRQGNRR